MRVDSTDPLAQRTQLQRRRRRLLHLTHCLLTHATVPHQSSCLILHAMPRRTYVFITALEQSIRGSLHAGSCMHLWLRSSRTKAHSAAAASTQCTPCVYASPLAHLRAEHTVFMLCPCWSAVPTGCWALRRASAASPPTPVSYRMPPASEPSIWVAAAAAANAPCATCASRAALLVCARPACQLRYMLCICAAGSHSAHICDACSGTLHAPRTCAPGIMLLPAELALVASHVVM